MSDVDAVRQEELAGGSIAPLEVQGQTISAALPPAAHTAERNRRLRKSVFTALLTRPLATVISLVSVPLLLGYLGKDGYGLYEAIIAFSVQLGMTNAGLTSGLLNKLTDCNVSGDMALARRYVSSLWFTLLSLVITLCVIATFITPFIHWQRLFVTADPRLTASLPWVVWSTAILTFLSMMLSFPASAYAAYQELDRNNYWDGAAKLVTLIGCFAVVHTSLGLIGAVLVMLGAQHLVRLLNCIYFFTIEKPWLRPSLRFFDRRALGSAAKEGLYIFTLQVAVLLIYQTDKLIISAVRGTEQVTDFAIVGRLFLQAYGVFTLLLAPLWPAYGEAIRRGDHAWVRRGLKLSILIGSAIIIAGGLALFFFGDFILQRLWRLGPGVSVSRQLVVATSTLFLVRVWTDCQSLVLNAAGVLVPQMILLGANALINLALAIFLAHRFGAVGVAWSFPISALCTSLWIYPCLIWRHVLRHPPDRS